MAVSSQLKELGWFLTPDGIKKCCKTGSADDVKTIIKNALNIDLRFIGASFLPSGVNNIQLDWANSDCVLQVAKIVNVAVPKSKTGSSSSPQLLRIRLTDGHNALSALNIEEIKDLGMQTYPGTKVKIKGGKITFKSGFFLLNGCNIEVLGGYVEPLVEKWKLEQSLVNYSTNKSPMHGGPPKWVPFGKRIANENEKSFGKLKSLDVALTKDVKENGSFQAQRDATIAEAINKARFIGEKVFGGGKQIISHDDCNITYKEPFARRPLREREPFDRRDGNLRKPDRKEKGKRGARDSQDADVVAFPSAPSTLFDFLATKMESIDIKSVSNMSGAKTTFFEPISPQTVSGKSETHPSSSKTVTANGSLNNRWNGVSERKQNLLCNGYRETRNASAFDRTLKSNSAGRSKRGMSTTKFRVGSAAVRSSRNSSNQQQSSSARLNDSSRYGSNSQVSFEGQVDQTRQPNRNDFNNQWGGGLSLKADFPSLNKAKWKSGERCTAKYWEDDKYYPAVVHAVADDGTTCVVLFSEYGNYEEVLVQDMQRFESANTPRSGGTFHRPSEKREFYRSGRVIKPSSSSKQPRSTNTLPGNNRRSMAFYVPPAQRQ